VIAYHSLRSDGHAGEEAHSEVVMYADAHITVCQPPHPLRLDKPARSMRVTVWLGVYGRPVRVLHDYVTVYLVDRLDLRWQRGAGQSVALTHTHKHAHTHACSRHEKNTRASSFYLHANLVFPVLLERDTLARNVACDVALGEVRDPVVDRDLKHRVVNIIDVAPRRAKNPRVGEDAVGTGTTGT
jgi:hypothetical protein